MKITEKKLPKSKLELTIEIEEKDWESQKQKTLKKLSQQVRIDGFRKGNIPTSFLMKHIGGEEALAEYALEDAISETYIKALREKKIRPLGDPKLNITAKNPPVFMAEVEVYPEVTVKKVDASKITPKEIKVTKKEIDETVETLQKQVAEQKPVERAVKKGDTVKLDYQGKNDKGEEKPELGQKGALIEVGAGQFIPGFEENLEKMKAGEEKEFEVTFPKDYHSPEYAGKKVTFAVKVEEVQETVLPELNEEFVEKITGTKKPVEELRTEIETSIREHKGTQDQEERENTLLELVAKNTECEIPDTLLEEQVNMTIRQKQVILGRQGILWEKFLETEKKTEEDMRKEVFPEAEQGLKVRLGLQEVLDDDNIELSDTEVAAEVDRLFGHLASKQKKEYMKKYKPGSSDWEELRHKLRVKKYLGVKLKEGESSDKK